MPLIGGQNVFYGIEKVSVCFLNAEAVDVAVLNAW